MDRNDWQIDEKQKSLRTRLRERDRMGRLFLSAFPLPFCSPQALACVCVCVCLKGGVIASRCGENRTG